MVAMDDPLLKANLARTELIVVGLGNPGPEYSLTRHNLGYRALDVFMKLEGLPEMSISWGKSLVQQVSVDGAPVLLAKPTTYMNLSGVAVASLLEVTGLSVNELLVIHDDMDLDLGRAKMKVGGGAAGHKGVEDIIARCGEEFTRIKIGIGKPPWEGEDAGVEWVLGEVGAEEEEVFLRVLPVVAKGIRKWVVDGPEAAMTWFNTKFKEEGEGKEVEGEEG